MALHSGRQRILVVDDAEEMRILIRRALYACGYDVDIAATLSQARGMDPGGYDAVLVDAHLGPERGVDLIDALRSEDPAAVARCLVMTGGVTETLPDDVTYLAKPFQLDELIDAVRSLHQPDAAPAHDREARIAVDFGMYPRASAPPGRNQPAAAEAQAWQLLGLSRGVRARERSELVDFLHDSPIQELAAATLELQMMSRSVPPPSLAARFDVVLQRLDAAAGSMRWLVDGNWPFMASETHLAAAILQRTAWLLAAPATVDTDESLVEPSAIEIPVIVDIVELMLHGMVPADSPTRAHVAVRIEEDLVQIELSLRSAADDDQPIGDPEAAEASLDGLACALGASVHAKLCELPWRAQIGLPRQKYLGAKQAAMTGD